MSFAANKSSLYHQPHRAEKSNRDSKVNSEKDRWAKTNSGAAALLMIQNKHLTKANIIDWNYIYGADKIFIQWVIKSGSGKQLQGY